MSDTTVSFQVRVRSRRYLWGGPGITANLNTQAPLFMTLNVQEGGESIALGQVRRDGGKLQEVALGSLGAGESYTVALNNISGLYADAGVRAGTAVICTIHSGK